MRISPADLHSFLHAIFVASGVPSDGAHLVGEHLVAANLAGHDSHGAIRATEYVPLIQQGIIDPAARPRIIDESASTAVIDGNWGLGFVVTDFGLRYTMDLARTHGLAAVTIRRQSHMGRLGWYTARAAEAGFVALMTADSGRAPKAVAPLGGRERRLGSNPISIAAPTREHRPAVLDMATSTVAQGKLRLASNRGERIPRGWIVDSAGEPTDDPDDYAAGGALLPLGADQAHKGYGLSFMVEVLSGLLTGIGFTADPDGFHNDGVFLALFDVSCFRPRADFEAEMSQFIEYLKATPLAPGHDEILYPGELEWRTELERRRQGIEIEQRTWEQLRELGQNLGIAPSPGSKEET